jgi:hypothetical protein
MGFFLTRNAPAAVAIAVVLAGCGSPQSALSVPGTPAQLRAAAPLGDATVPHIAGTYDGTLSETENMKSVKGSLVATIDQSGSNISGSFSVKFDNDQVTLPIKGTVKSSKGGAALRFTIIDTGGKGRNAKARGFIIKGRLHGKAFVPPTSSKAAVYIKFSARKK